MEDAAIVDLYWQRSDLAILETDKKYGRYCHAIAYHKRKLTRAKSFYLAKIPWLCYD